MKLVRYGQPGQEKPGLIDAQGALRDLSGVVADIGGAALAPESLARIAALDASTLPRVDGQPRHGCPVAGVGKIVCVGLNYADHAAESGLPVPAEPVLFLKPSSSITGPDDDVIIPRGSVKTDWEVELGVVIGKKASYVEESEALEYVAGYVVVNDVSEREYQIERGGQWDRARAATASRPSALAGNARRDRRPAEPGHVAGGQRQALPGRQHPHHGVRREATGQLHQPVHVAAARRRHQHRHAARRGPGPEAAALPEGRRCHAPGHRGPGRAVAETRAWSR